MNMTGLALESIFWEVNPKRALAFAEEVKARNGNRIREPFVVGAVVDLRNCLDLTTAEGVEQVRIAYQSLREGARKAGQDLPKNSSDQLRRNLDCAVINRLHSILAEAGAEKIDTVKGVFLEGSPAYPGSGLMEKTHTQIAVRNPECIRGVFRVPGRAFRG